MTRLRRTAAALTLIFVLAPPLRAAALEVVINEIGWAGTAASSSDEWVELLNNTTAAVDLSGWTWQSLDGSPSVVLAGTVPAAGFFLLERTDNATVSDVAADQLFSGAIANGPPAEDFVLRDAGGVLVDQVLFSTAGWPAGNSSEFTSMERRNPQRAGSLRSNWAANNKITRNGKDAGGAALNGTPKAANSAFGTAALELCDNAADDDDDGAVDCADEGCFSDGACALTSGAEATKVLEVDGARNPFSPHDADPAFRSARLLFNAGSPSVLKTVRIADARGETVRTLVNTDRGPAGLDLGGQASGVLFWDGRDDDAHVLPVGIYVVVLEGTDPATGGRVRGKDTLAIGR